MKRVAEIHISYSPGIMDREKVLSSSDAYDVFVAHWDKDLLSLQEEFKVMMLNQAGEVHGILSLSKGGLTGTTVDPKLLFAAVLKCAASRIIIAHNHPSGTLKPSKQDIMLTSKVKQGALLLDIQLTDHLILSHRGYYSFLDEGVI